MAVIDWSKFLDLFCQWVAAQTSLVYATTPRQLWQGSAVEADAADVYTVLRLYGGSIPPVPTPLVQVQARTEGIGVAAVMTQSAAVFGCLVDAQGAPLRMATIAAPTQDAAGVRANGIDPRQPPSLISRDDRGRAEVVFNFEMRLAAL